MKIAKTLTGISFLMAGFIGLTSCGGGSDIDGFDKAESGYYFKIHKKGDKEQHPKQDEELSIVYDIRIKSKDSVIFDSKKARPDGIVPLILRPVSFKGSFEEALMSMNVGDSSSFLVNADSFFLKTVGMTQLPPWLKPGDKMQMNIALKSIRDAKTVADEQKKREAEMMSQMKEMEMQSKTDLEKYIADNKITVAPTPSGLYYIETKKGKGAKVKVGDVVQCYYKGALLNGQVFQDVTGEPKPIEFPVGVQQLIPGWDEGIPMMNIGGKARLIIPYQLGYGPQGDRRGNIPPFATLVFDIEIVGVKENINAPAAK